MMWCWLLVVVIWPLSYSIGTHRFLVKVPVMEKVEGNRPTSLFFIFTLLSISIVHSLLFASICSRNSLEVGRIGGWLSCVKEKKKKLLLLFVQILSHSLYQKSKILFTNWLHPVFGSIDRVKIISFAHCEMFTIIIAFSKLTLSTGNLYMKRQWKSAKNN